MNLVDGLGFKHLLVVFAASIAAGFFVVIIDSLVIVPAEKLVFSGQTFTPA